MYTYISIQVYTCMRHNITVLKCVRVWEYNQIRYLGGNIVLIYGQIGCVYNMHCARKLLMSDWRGNDYGGPEEGRGRGGGGGG